MSGTCVLSVFLWLRYDINFVKFSVEGLFLLLSYH